MHDHAEHVIALTTKITYSTSAVLVFLQFLNTYAAAFGVLLAFCTFIVNWVYQHKNRQLLKQRIEKDDIEEYW